MSISRGEVSAYLQSVCIQIGFKSRPSVYCELASVAGDGWSWIKAICELDQSLLKSPTWIGLKIPLSYKVIKVSSSVLVSNVKTINTDKSSRNTILKPQTNSVFATHWDFEKVDWYQYSIVIEIRTHKRFGRVKTISVLVPTIICLALKCCLTFCIMNLPSYH